MKITMGLHPKTLLMPSAGWEEAYNQCFCIFLMIFFFLNIYKKKHRSDIAPSTPVLLLLHIFFATVVELQLNNFVSLQVCLSFTFQRNICSRVTVQTEKAIYAIPCPNLFSEAIQGSSVPLQICEVTLRLVWLKTEILWVTKVEAPGEILWIEQARVIL